LKVQLVPHKQEHRTDQSFLSQNNWIKINSSDDTVSEIMS